MIDIPATVQQRADRGIALLDETRPGWAKQIDVEILDLSSFHSCVLAQLFGGSYFHGRDKLFGDNDNFVHGILYVGAARDRLAAEYGFYPHDEDDDNWSTEYWKQAILARQSL